MAVHDRKTGSNIQGLLLATLAVLTVGYGAAGLARAVAEFGPAVGDIVAFDPARPAGFDSDARLTATRTGAGACLLDVGVLRRSGGSLILEQRTPAPTRLYRAHWAGPRTSDNQAEDCGRHADLTLTFADINAIAAAAGGFGPDHRPLLQLR